MAVGLALAGRAVMARGSLGFRGFHLCWDASGFVSPWAGAVFLHLVRIIPMLPDDPQGLGDINCWERQQSSTR